jgi:hypothetical protein
MFTACRSCSSSTRTCSRASGGTRASHRGSLPRRLAPRAGSRGPEFGQWISRGDCSEALRRAYNASRLDDRRRFRCPRPNVSRNRRRRSNRSRSGRDERGSRDERNSVASPTGSRGADSLIQTSTTQGKTCRPNRGRSRRQSCGPATASAGSSSAKVPLSNPGGAAARRRCCSRAIAVADPGRPLRSKRSSAPMPAGSRKRSRVGRRVAWLEVSRERPRGRCCQCSPSWLLRAGSGSVTGSRKGS